MKKKFRYGRNLLQLSFRADTVCCAHSARLLAIPATCLVWLLLAASCLYQADSIASEAAPKDAGRAILVLDASGSMWGKVQGKTKVEIARESIARLMLSWNQDIELGLMAYGHRRKGDCEDIELILPVARQLPDAVIHAVNGLNARGKTPLSAAVRNAAELLGYTEQRATVILISDGIETCNMDPCAMAEELEQAGVAFTAHVIGFDLKKEELPTLKCLAEGTGGMFIEAVDAESLSKALSVIEETVAAAPPAIKVPPASILVAVLDEGMPPLEKQEINWYFTETEKGPDGRYKSIDFQRSTRPRVRLERGTYRVEVKTGLVTTEATIDVDPEKETEYQIDLDAGQVTLIGFNKEGGERLKSRFRWDIDAVDTGDDTRLRHLTYTTGGGSPTYTLPAGRYRITMTSGDARQSVMVDVAPGAVFEQEVYLNAGQVKLQGFLSEGGPPLQRVTWHVTREKPGASGEYEAITYSSGLSPTFTLAEGTYRIIAESGTVKKTFDIEIIPDQYMEKQLSLDAGRVKLIAVDEESGDTLQGIRWSITRPDPNSKGEYERITYSSGYTPTFTLEQGSYRVVIEHAGGKSTAMIEVRAGDGKEVRVRVAKPR